MAFAYRDLRGTARVGRGRLYLNAALGEDPDRRLPVVVEAGYTQPDDRALTFVRTGCLYATVGIPDEGDEWPGAHPISRGLNLDLAFLHVVRALPFVDPLRVIVQGISIGGRNSLLMAAETFPLLGVLAQVPPLDWRWNAAYLQRASGLARVQALTPDQLKEPLGLAPVGDVVDVAVEAFGPVSGGVAWRSLSPLRHLDAITSRVAMVVSTADMLVPVGQVAGDLAPARDAELFPADFSPEPVQDDVLGAGDRIATLLDLLPETHVIDTPLPAGAELLNYANPDDNHRWTTVEMIPSTRRCSVMVIDEGPIEPRLHHFKHQLGVDQTPVVRAWLAEPEVGDLNAAKLEVLLSRLAGIEWMPSDHRQLDDPDAEREDVLNGLAAWLGLPGATARLIQLYAEAPAHLRVLDDAACRRLGVDPAKLVPPHSHAAQPVVPQPDHASPMRSGVR